MTELRKDDPVYYEVEINKLIKQARENGLKVGYEVCWQGSKVTKAQVCFMNAIGEIAGATVYDGNWGD